MTEEERRKTVRRMARYGSIVFLLPSSVLAGYFIGNYLDDRLHTDPWFTIVFLCLGAAAGFLQLFRILGSD